MLIGRDAELGAVRAGLDAGSVVVTGEAGVGKTALLDAVLAGRTVLAGQCFRSLAASPALPLQQAVGPLPVDDATHAAHRVVTACGEGVLRLDDLQWADPFSLEVLERLPPGVRIAATVRSGEDGATAALGVLARLGALTIALEPLATEDAAELAQRLHPRLPIEQARRLAARCGGNPLLVLELGADAGPSVGLRRSVVTRLRRHGADVWLGFGMLALAGAPVPPSWLPDPSGLVDSGLVAEQEAEGGGRGLVPRHPLLADVVAEELRADPAQRTSVSTALADAAERAGLLMIATAAAVEAGDHARGRALALRASELTDRPGERATLLHAAATCSTGADAEQLSVRAVRLLVDAGFYARAADLMAGLPGLPDAVPTAEWHALRGRVCWETGDDPGAVAAWEAAVAAAEPRSRMRVRCALEHARAVLLGLGDVPRALELARIAAADADRFDVERARARSVLGTAENLAGLRESLDHLRTAIDLAVAAGEVEVEFTSINNLVASYESMDEPQLACALADRGAARAAELGLLGWQQQLTAMALNTCLHTGQYARVLDEAPLLLAGALQPRTRDQVEILLDLVLVDVGGTDEALARLATGLRVSVDDRYGRGNLLWVDAEARLWSGDLAGAVEAAQAALDVIPDGDLRLFPHLTLAHAQVRAGLPVSVAEAPPAAIPILAAAPAELAGHRARAAGDLAAAVAGYAEAAALWRGRHRRGELRCRWLAADSRPDSPAERDAARAELLTLEAELAEAGWEPLLAQVRRSLRARGVRSAAPRGRAGAVTAREREVLELVGAGHSTAVVAARLGVSPATVAAQVASARAKLGATTRRQAASGA